MALRAIVSRGEAREAAVVSPAERTTGRAAPAGSSLAVLASLVAVYLIWGSTYLGIRVAVADFPPLLMAGIRFLIPGALLVLVLRVRGVPFPARREWGGASVVALFLLVLGNGGVTVAEQWVASGISAVVVATVPLWSILFTRLLGQRPTQLEWVGVFVGLAGIALLNTGSDLRASPLGALLLLAASGSWALGSVWSRRLSLPPGLMGSAASMLIAGGVFLLLGVAGGERLPAHPTTSSLWAIAYLSVMGSLVAFSAYSYLLRHVRPVLATSYAYVNPAVAVVLGVLLLHERITPLGFTALAIVILAVVLVILGPKREI